MNRHKRFLINYIIKWLVVFGAHFAVFAGSVTITSSVDGKGLVLGTGTYEIGTQISLKAVPQVDWKFDHWEGLSDAALRSDRIDFVVSENFTVKCVFSKNEGLGRFNPKNSKVIGWSYQTDSDWGKSAVQIPDDIGEVVMIAAGGGCSFALRSDGTIVGWGSNANRQLDIPSRGKVGFSTLAASPYHCIAVRSDGTSVGWGSNGGWSSASVPPGLGMSNDAVGAAVGEGFQSFIILNRGGIYGWGNNRVGGDGGIFVGSAQAPVGASNIVSVACGAYHNVAMRKNGNLIAWGWNNWGQANVPTNLLGLKQLLLVNHSASCCRKTAK